MISDEKLWKTVNASLLRANLEMNEESLNKILTFTFLFVFSSFFFFFTEFPSLI